MAYSSDLYPAGVVEELSTGAHKAGLLAGVLLKHITGAEVVGEERRLDALSHTRMEQPVLVDLLHQRTNSSQHGCDTCIQMAAAVRESQEDSSATCMSLVRLHTYNQRGLSCPATQLPSMAESC